MSFLRPIHHTFAPHVDSAYLCRTLALLCKPWKWKEGSERESLRHRLAERFGADAFLFASGREALTALLRSLACSQGAEVIVQAYTCMVVPNAIQAAGMTPIYADIDRDSLNLSAEEVERRLTPRTCAIMCQHTFGIPADTHKLRALCDRYNLLLIEDCAHVIPDDSGPSTIGRNGDFLLLSFGRDKAISGITGGAMLSRLPAVSVRLAAEEGKAASLSIFTIKRLLLYPLVYAIARPLYGIGLGKFLLVLARTIGALVPILTKEEKQGHMSSALHRLPNACAALALAELSRLKEINDHRRFLTALYYAELLKSPIGKSSIPTSIHTSLPLQKFPLFVRGAQQIRQALKKENMHLNDGWTGCVVCPASISLEETGYRKGSDPQAEEVCEEIISLPTHPTMKEEDAKRLVQALSTITNE